MIFSTPKCQAGLCKLYPFLPVTKQSRFTDLKSSSCILAASKGRLARKRFPKILPLESVLLRTFSERLETRGTLECRYIWRTERAAKPIRYQLVHDSPKRNRHTHTRLFYREWLISRHAALLNVPTTVYLAGSEGLRPPCVIPSIQISLASLFRTKFRASPV